MLVCWPDDFIKQLILIFNLYILLPFHNKCHGYGKQIENCGSLQGTWYNQLGSQLILVHLSDGTLEGEYRTSVEVEIGDAGTSHSIVVGSAPYLAGASFGFSVVWNGGQSTTVWTGQCVVCLGGHEKLLTTWLLHSMSSNCHEKWKANRIGRDIFTRYQQKPGPRKDLDTHIPERPLSYSFSIEGNSKSFVKVKNSKEPPKPPPCQLAGTWYNELGSEIILNYDKSGLIKGEYRTAVEREEGTAGNTHSRIYGIGNYNEPNTTFGFHVVWRRGASVTGFVGQCFSTCGLDALDKMETLEVNWILWQGIDKCQDHWRSTLYGINTFTKYEQAAGPRQKENTHVPNRAGEDIEEEVPASDSSHSIHDRHLAIISTRTLLFSATSILLICL